jgi:uncharacterized coiled-coil protein SlyX
MQTLENKIKNLEFQIAFTETNIRYLLADKDWKPELNEILIKEHRKTIEKCQKEIEECKKIAEAH